MTELRIFVGHPFGDRHYEGGVTAFRRAITSACKRATTELHRSGLSVTLLPFFVSREYGKGLPGIVRQELEECSIGIFDLTGTRPNVLFELGYLTALNRPCVTMMKAGTKLPSDVVDTLVGEYASPAALVRVAATRIAQAVKDVHGSHVGRSRTNSRNWFAYNPSVITLVCAPETERSRFASRDEANYLFIDGLEDRDALFEVATFLSRSFPHSRVDRFASDAVPTEALHGDLVVIGGPGDPNGTGNHVCRDVLRLTDAAISYGSDCDRAFFKKREYVPQFDSTGRLEVDYGYFLRAPNPFNPDRTVIVVCGVYTSGTLGAALAFSDHATARDNGEVLRQTLGGGLRANPSFEACFPVEVTVAGAVHCPRVLRRHISKR